MDSDSSYEMLCKPFYSENFDDDDDDDDGDEDDCDKSLLHIACCNGSVLVVEYILECLPSEKHLEILKQQHHSNHTALHFAIESGGHELVKLFTELVPKDNFMQLLQCNGDVGTPLHAAAMSNNLAIAKCLLDSVPTDMRFQLLSKHDHAMETPLHSAACNANAAMLDCVVGYCTQDECIQLLNCTDIGGNNALQSALMAANSFEVVQYIMNMIPADERISYLMNVNGGGRSSFQLAARYANVDILKFLLSFLDADQCITALKQHDLLEGSILHHACCNQDNKLLKCLFDRIPTDQRFDFLQEKDHRGNTSFHLAAKNVNTGHMDYLLQFINTDQLLKALEQQNQDGTSMLHHACLKQDSKLLKSLLDRIPTDHRFNYIQKLDHKLQTPLHFAARNANADIVNCLVRYFSQNECNLLLKAADIDSNSVLQYALKVTSGAWWMRPSPHCSRKVSLEVVQCIMRNIPADQRFGYLMKVDGRGRTSLHLAAYANADVMEFLLGLIPVDQRIAAAEIKDQEGQLLLHHACLNEDVKMTKTVLDTIPTEDHVRLLLIEDNNGVAAIHFAFINADKMRGILETTFTAYRLINLLEKQSWLTSIRNAFQYEFEEHFDILVLLQVLDLFPEDLQLVLLKLRDDDGMSILHCLCEPDDDGELQEDCIMDIIKNILQPLSSEQRIRLLLMKDKRDRTLLHCLYSNKVIYQQVSQDEIKQVLELVPVDQRIQLLLAQDESGMTVLHCLCAPVRYVFSGKKYINDIIGYILRGLPSEQRMQLLLKQDKNDRTFLHCLSSNKDVSQQAYQDVMKLIREFVPADRRIHLFDRQDESGMTVLHHICLFRFSRKNAIDHVLSLVTTEQCCQLLLLQDKRGMSALHCLSDFYDETFQNDIKSILELFPSELRIKPLLLQDNNHKTFLHCICMFDEQDSSARTKMDITINTLQAFQADRRLQLLLVQDNRGRTPLHYLHENAGVGDSKDKEMMSLILETIATDQHNQLLTKQDSDGMTALHLLCVCKQKFWSEYYRKEVLSSILRAVPAEHHTEVLSIRDKRGRTALHALHENMGVDDIMYQDAMHLILDHVKADQCRQLLSIQDEDGITVLHLMCERERISEPDYSRMNALKQILQVFPDNHAIEFLMMLDNRGRTALHSLCDNIALNVREPLDVIKLAMEYFPVDELSKPVTMQDDRGKTVLHCLCDNKNISKSDSRKHVVDQTLQLLQGSQRVQILLIQDNSKKTLLHHMCNLGCTDLSKLLGKDELIKHLPILSQEQCVHLLLAQDSKGRTVLHHLCSVSDMNDSALLAAMKLAVEQVPADKRLEMVMKQDEHGRTVVHYALIVWKAIHALITATQFTQLLNIQDNHGRTALQYPMVHGCAHDDVIGCLEIVTADQRHEILHKQDNEGKTALHTWSEHHRSGESLKQMVQLVPLQRQVPLSFVVDKKGATALHNILIHIAAFNTQSLTQNVMLRFLDLITMPERYLLLIPMLCTLARKCVTAQHKTAPTNFSMSGMSEKPGELEFQFLESVPVGHHCTLQVKQTTSYGQTVFQFVIFENSHGENQIGPQSLTAALNGYASLLECLLKSISNQQKLVLQSRLDAGDSEVEPWNTRESFDVLENFLTEARVCEIVVSSDDEEKRRLLIGITDDAPLDVLQIERLSAHSERFILPRNQTLAKCYGIILYNKEGREGATMEAIQLEEALTALGCHVRKLDWTNASRLNELVNTEIHKIRDSCFLLFVCIMSHGKPGMLEGSNGSRVPVNDVLFQFETHLHHNIPLVMMIQSCQLYGTEGHPSTSRQGTLDARMTSAPVDNKHIVLRRPNTALLLSTVSGGGAYRGVFTGAMAEQLCKADGETELHTLFPRAVHSMKQNQPQGQHQIPEIRSTMTLSLYLHSQLSVTRKRHASADKMAAKCSKTD